MSGRLAVLLKSPLFGIVVVIVLLSVVLTLFAGTHVDRTTGATVNNFLNANTLLQIATDASFFAIMAIGATGPPNARKPNRRNLRNSAVSERRGGLRVSDDVVIALPHGSRGRR